MEHDFAHHLVTQWRQARPDLDPSSMSIVVRILRVASILERRLAALLAPHGLSVWEFDVLASLRRNPSTGLPPKRLLHELLLSSGAMTHRIDRLEAAGLVERTDDPSDRRGVLVRLTRQGRAIVDRAVEDRFADADEIVGHLDAAQARAVDAGLRRLALALQEEPWP